MNAEYIQRGESLHYTNATEAAIPAGSVVDLVSRIGVAGTDIPAGGVGSLHMVGVFQMKKKASEAIAMGDPVYFDKEAGEITKTGAEGKIPAGYATEKAEAADETVNVNIGFTTPVPAAAAAG